MKVQLFETTHLLEEIERNLRDAVSVQFEHAQLTELLQREQVAVDQVVAVAAQRQMSQRRSNAVESVRVDGADAHL